MKTDLNKLIQNGNEAIKNENWQEGVEIWKEVNDHIPDNFGILMNYSACLSKIGKYKESIKTLQKVDKLIPLNPDVFFSMGVCYEALKDFDNALESYKKHLKINKESFDGWIRLALNHRYKKEFQTAINIYIYLTQNFKAHAGVVIELAATYYENGETEKAEQMLLEIIEKRPNTEHARKVLSRIYHQTGRKEEAIKLEKEEEGNFSFSPE